MGSSGTAGLNTTLNLANSGITLANPVLVRFLQTGGKTLSGTFDFIFIDADKGNYLNYFEATLPLLAPNGLIAVDNVLWSGRVLDPKEKDDHAIVAFNDHIQNDARVTNVMLTVRDGLTLIRRA